jgi:hypothetical protein
MDYKNGKIYKIIDNAYTKMYIGSTTQPLYKRFSWHKSHYITWKNNNKRGKVMVYDIFDEFGVDNCKIELIEEFPCENRIQLDRKEGEYIKTNDCVNKCIAGRTPKEYYQANKDEKLQYWKGYAQLNKDTILERQKKYRDSNKEIIKEREKKYYEANRDKILEKKKKYYESKKIESNN